MIREGGTIEEKDRVFNLDHVKKTKPAPKVIPKDIEIT